MAATIEPESLYVQLGRLVESWPNLNVADMTIDTHRWLGRATALVEATGDNYDLATLKVHIPLLGVPPDNRRAEREVTAVIYRALARAEAAAPAAVRDSFIPAGNDFDAIASVGKILQTAKANILIVDPYMDEKALTTFAVLAAEGIGVRLLADQKAQKPSFQPAVTAWTRQYGSRRPLEARLTAPGVLHDRVVIVDGAHAWTLTQSLNAFASRSPASIVRVDDETAALKVAAYDAIWTAATAI